jgi:predicted nuclease of predicted toxin-antitoxin system
LKVLFDHNVPRKLRRILQGHVVRTAVEMGWAELENGELLSAAEVGGFAVMVTGDQNLSYQQNREGRSLALVVLSTNNWNVIKLHPEPVEAAVRAATPGSFQTVTFWPSIQ